MPNSKRKGYLVTFNRDEYKGEKVGFEIQRPPRFVDF